MATIGNEGARQGARCRRSLLGRLALCAVVAMPSAGAAWAQNLVWNGDFAVDLTQQPDAALYR